VILRSVVTLAVLVSLAGPGYGQVTVPTAQYNNLRTAANLSETVLTTSNVNSLGFGKLFSRDVDAEIYAHPLIVPNVTIPGKGTHNVVYVATGNNTVYAFDADDPAQSAPLWSRNLGPSVLTGGGDVQPNWGILGTPVIYNGVIYLVAVIASTPANWALYMCALDITTGADKYAPPTQVLFPKQGTTVPATPFTIQRAALLAANDTIYVAFANFDAPSPDLHLNQTGFVYSYSPADITKPTHIFQPASNLGSCGGGVTWRGGDVWQAGRGLAADSSGNLFLSTGNGFYDGASNFANTLLKLSPDLTLKDWFTPANWAALCQGDLDFGASGPILVPSLNYVIAGGKEGVLYVLNQSRLGGLQLRSSAGPVTQFHATNGCHLVNCAQSLSMAYWDRSPNPMLFVWDLQDVLRAFTFNGPRLVSTPSAVGSLAPNYTGGVSISANGSTPGSGILWATTSTTATEETIALGTLHAYDASNIGNELWNSDMNAARDALGDFTKFSIPVVANGKVYVITQSNELQVYGLLPVAPLSESAVSGH
jgi:outer membrane protein assembly factor BamB